MKNKPSSVRAVAVTRDALWLSAVIFATVSHAHDFKRGELTIAHPFIRVDPVCDGGLTRAYVMLLINQGSQADQLTGATLNGKHRGRLMTLPKQKSSGLQAVTSIPLPAKSEIALMPPTLAIEFPVASKDFQTGAAINATLQFERAGAVPVNFMVEAASSSGKACGLAAPSTAPAHHGAHAGHKQ